ncbi:cobalamin-dependent protein [Enemella dayhoffiae]|nr:cobalamin-dependent protein [Enemella dayhoffiae]
MAAVPSLQLLRWIHQYGLLENRGGLGMFIDDDNVVRLLRMSELVARGVPEAEAVQEVRGLGLAGTPELPHRGSELVARGHAGDVAALEELLLSRLPRPTFEEHVDRWLMPELRRVGEAWASDEMTTQQEEFVSSGVLAHLYARLREPAHAPLPMRSVVLGLPAGQYHEIPVLTMALALHLRGIRVHYLGAAVPKRDWVSTVIREGATAVVLAARSPSAARAATDLTNALAKVAPGCSAWVGGSHCDRVRNALCTPDSFQQAAQQIADSLGEASVAG